MAKNDFPKATPAGKYPLGNAKNNKSADSYTGFVYPTGGGNDIGIYKQPMQSPVANEMDTVHTEGNNLNDLKISLGNNTKGYKQDNPYGVKEMRGYGAATKGRKISGKQG
jgi:hypothetical protein